MPRRKSNRRAHYERAGSGRSRSSVDRSSAVVVYQPPPTDSDNTDSFSRFLITPTTQATSEPPDVYEYESAESLMLEMIFDCTPHEWEMQERFVRENLNCVAPYPPGTNLNFFQMTFDQDPRRFAILYYTAKFRALKSLLTLEDQEYIRKVTDITLFMFGITNLPRYLPGSRIDLLDYVTCPESRRYDIARPLKNVVPQALVFREGRWPLTYMMVLVTVICEEESPSETTLVTSPSNTSELDRNRAIDITPEVKIADAGTSSDLITDLKRQGQEHYNAGRHAEAARAFTEALAEVKDLQIPRKNKSELFSGRAAANVGLKKWDEVEKDCKQALRLDSNCLKAYQSLSHVYASRGHHDQLISHLAEYYGVIPDAQREERKAVIENVLRLPIEPETRAKTVINLPLDPTMWKFLVESLYTTRNYSTLYHVIRSKRTQAKDHPLSRFSAGALVLSEMQCGEYDVYGEIVIWLLKHGAPVSRLCGWVGLEDRPASYAVWLAYEHEHMALLNYLLASGEQLKELDYPNADGFHELLRACAEREEAQRAPLLSQLKVELRTDFETDLTIEVLKSPESEEYSDLFTLLDEWRDEKQFGPIVAAAKGKKKKKKGKANAAAVVDAVVPEPSPSSRVEVVQRPVDPCAGCERRLAQCESAKTSKEKVDVYELLCPVVDEQSHVSEKHQPLVKSACSFLVKAMGKREDVPPRVGQLSEAGYRTLLLAAPSDWALVLRMIRSKSGTCTLAQNLDLASFIESDFLLQSPKYREEAVRTLLAAGASAKEVTVAKKGCKTPLEVAAGKRDASCVKALIEYGADPRQFHFTDQDTPLHAALTAALSDGDTSLLEYFRTLYESDHEKYRFLAPNTRDGRGDTLLHLAARIVISKNNKVLRLVEYLRGFNIDPNSVNKEKKRAQDYLDTNDRRRRFLQADVGTAQITMATTSATSEPTPSAPQRSNAREKCRQRLTEIVGGLAELSVVADLELSESESEDEDEANAGSAPVAYKETAAERKLIEGADLTLFDDLPWEVECTTDVWRTLLSKRVDKRMRRIVVHRIRQLASGDIPASSVLSDDLYTVQLGSTAVIWQIAIAFSGKRSETGRQKVYAEIIRVWDVVLDPAKVESSRKRIAESNRRGKRSAVQKRLRGLQGQGRPINFAAGSRFPEVYLEDKSENESARLWAPPASSKENEYHIMKFYAFTSVMAAYIVENDGTKVEFPFNVTDIEYTYIHLTLKPPAPLLILGRSGTGKTTCCLYRLWAKYQTYWETAATNQEPLLPRFTTNPTPENETESGICDHLHQVFVTKNRVLTREVKKNFAYLCQTSSAVYKDVPLPTKLQSVPSEAFPLFLTSRQFLLLLDGSLPHPFFTRDESGAMLNEVDGWGTKETKRDTFIVHDDDSDDETNVPAARKKARGTKREVTYEIFAHELWPRLRRAIKKTSEMFHPSLVWMEIISFIKGSLVAMRSVSGFLTSDEYETLGRKQAPHFTGDRSQVYAVFTEYQKALTAGGYFDECDVIHHVYQRLVDYGRDTWVLHQVYVDEVQDFTQSELGLLIQTCQEPNSMFFTGDTAQSIMRGVAFRFKDLKTLFYGISESLPSHVTVGVPKHVYELAQNYRSHAGVIRLANGIIDLLNWFFPESFDHVEKDVALFEGPKPILFDSVQFEDLALVLRGNRRHVSQIEFGAHQAIIVANDAARDSVPEELSHCLILTVYESKGLEFDDVLLFNFFKDSEAKKEWRVVSEHLQDMVKRQDSDPADSGYGGFVEVDLDSLDPNDRAHPLAFNSERDKILNSELKHLYTAITRARVNVWVYDEDVEGRKPMFEYFKALRLVTSKTAVKDGTSLEEVFVKKSTARDWRRIGKEFYLRNQYRPASKCFKRAGDEVMYKICEANQRAVAAQVQDKLSESERKDEFLSAALQFLDCPRWRDLLEKGAGCLRNAREPQLAAKVYASIGKFPEAASLYKRCKMWEQAVHCYERADRYDEAIRVLCEQKQFQEALQVWKVYEAKVKESRSKEDVERLRHLERYHPESRDDKRTIAFRVAGTKLQRDDIEAVTNILSDLGWTLDSIAEWMADKGKHKAAAKLLEKRGRYLEAAARYREMNDYPSAILCLDRCKDLPNAKRQLADSYMIMCRRYYHDNKGEHGEVVAGEVSREQYREYMDHALEYYEALGLHNLSADCLLIDAALEKSRDLYQSANEEFVLGGSDIGQFESLYRLMKLGGLDDKSRLVALRLLKSILNGLRRKSGSVYDDMHQFYGIDEGVVDANAQSRIADLNKALIGRIDVAQANEIIRKNLLKKIEYILRKTLADASDAAAKSTPCRERTGSCDKECPYFHGKVDPTTFTNHVQELKQLVLVHGTIVDSYLTDTAVSDLLDKITGSRGFDLNCADALVKLLFLHKPIYAHQPAFVERTLKLLEGKEIEAMLCVEADLRMYENTADLKVIDSDATGLMYLLYGSLLSGERREGRNFPKLNKLLAHLEEKSEGWPGVYKHNGMKNSFFRICLQSFQDHYTHLDLHMAVKTLNQFLRHIAVQSRHVKSLKPSICCLMPMFELQFMRGVMLYLKASPGVPAFLPQTYLNLLNVFDRSCGGDTHRILNDYVIHSPTFHTNVRNQLTTLCEIFLGVRSRQFNVTKDAAASRDANLVERVLTFAFVLLVNVGLVIDENLSFVDYRSKKNKQRVSVATEEVVIRRIQRLVKEIKLKSARLTQLHDLIQKTRGPKEVAVGLCGFVNACPGDRFMECSWGERFVIAPATSHEELENDYYVFQQDQSTDAYKLLNALGDAHEPAAEPDDKTVLDHVVPVQLAQREEVADEFVDERRCDVCGTIFNAEDATAAEAERHNHVASPEHANMVKVFQKYRSEVGPFVDGMTPVITNFFGVCRHLEEPNPDEVNQIYQLHQFWLKFDVKRKDVERRRDWKSSGMLTLLINKITEMYNVSFKMIQNRRNYAN